MRCRLPLLLLSAILASVVPALPAGAEPPSFRLLPPAAEAARAVQSEAGSEATDGDADDEVRQGAPGGGYLPRIDVFFPRGPGPAGEPPRLAAEGRIATVHDPYCGTGGMLTITKDVIGGSVDQDGINPTAGVFLFGRR